MLSIGATLKQIRRNQGLTQAELYDGLISPSFASRLERGKNDVTVTTFFAILVRLNIDPTEFQFIQRDYQPTEEAALQGAIQVANSQQNFPWLRHLEQRYRHSQQPGQQALATLADLSIKVSGSAHYPVTPAMEQLWNQLNRASQWTLFQICQGVTWLAIAEAKGAQRHLMIGIQKMHASCARYLSDPADTFQVQQRQLDFDLFAMQLLVTSRQYSQAKRFWEQNRATTPERLGIEARVNDQTIQCIWEWYFGDIATGDHLAAQLNQMPASKDALNIHMILISYRRFAEQYRQQLTK